MNRGIVLLPVDGIESESAVGARTTYLVANLRPHESGDRRCRGIDRGPLRRVNVADHAVSLQCNDITFDQGKPDLERLARR